MAGIVTTHTKPRAARLMEARRALDMHVAGVEDDDICRELQISTSTLRRRIKWALEQVVDPSVADYRAEAAARIRESRRRLYATLSERRPLLTIDGMPVTDPRTGEPMTVPVCDPTQVASLTAQLIRLEELEAKLRGGFAPTQINVRHVVEDAFDVLMRELEATPPAPAPQDAG
jgi:hypothetical protein